MNIVKELGIVENKIGNCVGLGLADAEIIKTAQNAIAKYQEKTDKLVRYLVNNHGGRIRTDDVQNDTAIDEAISVMHDLSSPALGHPAKAVQDVCRLFPGLMPVAMNDDDEDRSLYGLSGIFKCTCMVGGKAQDFVVFQFDWNNPLR